MLPKTLSSLTAEVTEILSDTKVRIKTEFGGAQETAVMQEAIAEAKASGIAGLQYRCVPHLDQQEMYRFVYERLRDGGCIGIFPEGMAMCLLLVH